MTRLTLAMCVLSCVHQLNAAELTLNQRLIVGCFDVDVDAVVKCLRDGADANARFGKHDFDDLFRDRWVGGSWVSTESWTPLLALATSDKYPPPPAGFQVPKDSDELEEILNQIPAEQMERRRRDAITILQVLLSHKCRLDDSDARGATALYWAADEGKVEMAKALLQHGANPNTKTGVHIDGPSDTTPLHAASNSAELLRLLLDNGADATAKDSKGRTAADWIASDPDSEFDLVETDDGWRIQPREKPATPPDDPSDDPSPE